MQKHLWLHDLGVREYLSDKYALWIDFSMINENTLQGAGRKVGSEEGGITLQIEKKTESAGALNAYMNLIMDAQLNIEKGAFIEALYQVTKMLKMLEYSTVRGSNRSRKNTFSIGFTREREREREREIDR